MKVKSVVWGNRPYIGQIEFEVGWFCHHQLWESRKGRSGHMAPEVT
jgi:hypothetical protein